MRKFCGAIPFFASLINRNIVASLTFYKFCNTVLNKIESHLKGQFNKIVFFHHTTRTGQLGQDSRDRTAGTEQQ
jgi:hypothetical protein